jgi:hypothetical protein
MHSFCDCPANEHRLSLSETRCRENRGSAPLGRLTEYEIELRHKQVDGSDAKPDLAADRFDNC